MKILLVNDDGIDSIGLKYLWESLKGLEELSIVAPSGEKSGAGAGVTFSTPLKVEPVDTYADTPAWRVSGTPVDCVKLAINALLPSPPDLILSGINRGSNAGRNVLYSGTIGGIIEGIFCGVPGVALSYSCVKTALFPHVKPFIPQIVDYLKEHPLPVGSLLNINFPHRVDGNFKGYRMARQGRGYWMGRFQCRFLSEKSYWEYSMQGAHSGHEEDEESDIALLDRGYITAVPIHVSELTDRGHLAEKQRVFEENLNRSFRRGDKGAGDRENR